MPRRCRRHASTGTLDQDSYGGQRRARARLDVLGRPHVEALSACVRRSRGSARGNFTMMEVPRPSHALAAASR